MPSTYTTNLGIEKIATGEQSGTWGNTTNTNLDILDQSIDGIISITLASAGSSGSPNSLPITDGAVSNGRNKFIEFVDGGDLGATAYVQLTPNDAEKIVHIRNSLSASRSIIVFQGTYNASNDYEILNGEDVLLKFDGAGAGAVVSQVFANLALPSVNIDGGTIDGAVIGGASAAAGSFTSLSASSPISAADGSAAAPSLSFNDDIDTGFYRAGANSIGVVLGGTEELTLNSTKASALDALGSVMSSTATAAAQRAALGLDTGDTPDFTGITIAGNTADVLNTFDYGFATNAWTPGVSFSGASVGVTYAYQVGMYAKIGRIVLIVGRVGLTNKGSSTGNFTVTGLPYTAANIGGEVCGAFFPHSSGIENINLGANYTGFTMGVGANTTNIGVNQFGDNVGNGGTSNTDVANNSSISFVGFYFASS
jgi:hypothetical protein